MPKKIRDRYARGKRSSPNEIRMPEALKSRLPPYEPETDPKNTLFILGLYFFLDPTETPKQEPFQGGELLVCD